MVPRHIERCRVAVVEGLVLGTHGVDGEAFGLHILDPLNEVGGIVLVVCGIEAAAGPLIVGSVAIDCKFHPFGTGPGGGNDLHIGVDGVDLAQDGQQVALVELGELPILNAGGVAAGVLLEREVGAADGDADEGVVHTLHGIEHLAEEVGAVPLVHQKEVVAGGAGDGGAPTVDGLVGYGVVEGDDPAAGGCGALIGYGDGLEEFALVGSGLPTLGGEGGDYLLGGELGAHNLAILVAACGSGIEGVALATGETFGDDATAGVDGLAHLLERIARGYALACGEYGPIAHLAVGEVEGCLHGGLGDGAEGYLHSGSAGGFVGAVVIGGLCSAGGHQKGGDAEQGTENQVANHSYLGFCLWRVWGRLRCAPRGLVRLLARDVRAPVPTNIRNRAGGGKRVRPKCGFAKSLHADCLPLDVCKKWIEGLGIPENNCYICDNINHL